MAAKKKGETATTVSVGIRIDPKIKFALDMLGREQKRSLTAVIEWAIYHALNQYQYDADATFSQVIEEVWSTDEATRFVRMGFHLSHLLNYDELRIWETIKISSPFWVTYFDDTFDTEPKNIKLDVVREHWSIILNHAAHYKNNSAVVPIKDEDLIEF